MSAEQEAEMIDWITSHEELFNKKKNSFKDKAAKERLWAEKAAEMGKTAAELKLWYEGMRTRYGRLKNIPSGSGALTERENFIRTQFEFLRPHIAAQKKRTLVSVSKTSNIEPESRPRPMQQCTNS